MQDSASLAQAPHSTVRVAPGEQLPHWPLEQTVPEQLWQTMPPVPQALELVPAWQLLFESQQPPHEFVGQVPPQPSEAPAHCPEQFGVQQAGGFVLQLVWPVLKFVKQVTGVPQYSGLEQLWQAPPLLPQSEF